MDIASYYKSLSAELQALKNRVRDFISGNHWLTDGEWKESVLRSIIARKLPDTVKIGRGFVLTNSGPTSQCDIILYRASSPVMFREGDLVFLTPDAVVGIIEVKTRIDSVVLKAVLHKFADIGPKMGLARGQMLFCLFAYKCDIRSDDTVLGTLREECDHYTKVMDLICLDESRFVKWWKTAPDGSNAVYEKWHSYKLEDMAPGYFICNVLHFLSPEYISSDSSFWFPKETKEANKTGEVYAKNALMEKLDRAKEDLPTKG